MAKSRGGAAAVAPGTTEAPASVVPRAPPTAVAVAVPADAKSRGRRPFRRKLPASLISLLALAISISLASSCFQCVNAAVAPISWGHLLRGGAPIGRRRLDGEEGEWEDDDDDVGVAPAAEEAEEGEDAVVSAEEVPAPPMALPEPAADTAAITIEAEEEPEEAPEPAAEEEATPAVPTVANLAPAAAQAGILLGKHWPPGCTYQCFAGRYPDLSFENEEVALEKFMEKAAVEKWDCSCDEPAGEAAGETESEPASGGEEEGAGGEDEGEPADAKDDPLEEEDVFEQLEEVQEELEELEGRGDPEAEEEIEELEELEGELIEEVMEEELFDDDAEFGEETVEDLEEELEEIEGEIEDIEEADDDGAWEEEKAEDIEELKGWEEEVKEELEEEKAIESMLNGTTLEGLNLDPSLTMDWTTLNPPNETAEESPEGEGVRVGDEDTKEAESSTLNIDTEPDRMPGGGKDAVVAGEVKEAESETEQIDVEPEREGDFDAPVAVAAKAVAQENIASEAGNETEAIVPPGDESVEPEGDNAEAGEKETSSPTQKATTASPVQPEAATQSPTEGKEETSSPTRKPTPRPTTAAPTVEYVEPNESLDPVEKEEEPSEALPWDDDTVEEPAPSAGGGERSSNKEYEEEAKKVGGWLSFASIILMIYTAYQMSENPDGICASLCRLVITVIGCIIKIMLIPFKYVMGGRPSGGHYMATPDYRDPYGSRHMELT